MISLFLVILKLVASTFTLSWKFINDDLRVRLFSYCLNNLVRIKIIFTLSCFSPLGKNAQSQFEVGIGSKPRADSVDTCKLANADSMDTCKLVNANSMDNQAKAFDSIYRPTGGLSESGRCTLISMLLNDFFSWALSRARVSPGGCRVDSSWKSSRTKLLGSPKLILAQFNLLSS